MSASKRKADDNQAITVYKKVPRFRSPKPPPKAYLTQAKASRLLQKDQLVVNSVEGDHRNRPVGFEHYIHLQENQPQREPTRETNSTDHGDCVNLGEAIRIDTDEQHEATHEPARDRKPSPHIHTDLPPIPRYSYYQPIFAATTQNPAVFLAITRLAQRNLSYLNFDSALNHLPNVPAAAALPRVSHGVFVDDTEYKKSKGDHEMQVLFLPRYYDDGRHALGYYALPSDLYGKYVSTCLFTPCTDTDLQYFNLVDSLDDRWVGACIGEESDWKTSIEAVGARNGRWLEWDVVEDWDEWTLGLQVVKDIWKVRFGLTTGVGEGGERWKPCV